MRSLVTLPLIVLLAACGSRPTAATAAPSAVSPPAANPLPSPFPAPVSGPHTVQGNIFDAQAGRLAAADVNLWVQQERFGYSYWWANGRLTSDSAGHFVAPNIPDSQITLLAVKDGYVQPCAVTADVTSDRVLDVELMATARFDTATTPRPIAATGPIVNGVIYETTAEGRQPVPGAAVWVGNAVEVAFATTRSDRGGRILLCNLPKDAFLYITKAGFNDLTKGPMDLSASVNLELEVTRR